MTPSCGTSSRPSFPRWLGKSEIGKSIRRRSLKDGPARRNPVLEPAPNRAHAHYVNFAPLRTPEGAIGAEFSGKYDCFSNFFPHPSSFPTKQYGGGWLRIGSAFHHETTQAIVLP